MALFEAIPHTFDVHTHRLPALGEPALYNLRVPHPHSISAMVTWLDEHPHTTVSVGIHPWDSEAWRADAVCALEALLTHPQVVAVGECGVDAYKGGDVAHQLAIFLPQIRLAQRLHLPLIIHCVKGQHHLLALRRDAPEALWIVHGFRGKPSVAQALWAKGIATSFGEHYHPDTLAQCPPHLRYHETDESSLTIADILQRHAPYL